MKKLLFAIGAIALLGLTSGCVDPVENNPNYDPVKDEVHTQFVLNIAAADPDAKTKQSAAAVQQPIPVTGATTSPKVVFRGLDNASLFCFNLSSNGRKMLQADIENTATVGAIDYIDLSTALKPGTLDPSGDDSNKSKSRRILDINLKTGTNTMLFYGAAVTDPNTQDGKNDFGLIDADFDASDMNKIGCWAQPRLQEFVKGSTTTQTDESLSYHAIEAFIEKVYNNCFLIGINGSSSSRAIDNKLVLSGQDAVFTESSMTGGSVTYNIEGVPIHWSDYTSAVESPDYFSPIPGLINAHNNNTALQNVKASPFEELLGRAYNAFINFDSTQELRAGSGPAVARQMTDLYIVMDEAADSDPTNAREAIAQKLIVQIVNYLKDAFNVPSPISTSNPLTWKDFSVIVQAFSGDYGITLNAPAKTNFGTNRTATLNNFPLFFDLPIGCSTMKKWTKDSDATHVKGFFYFDSHDIKLPGMGGGKMTVHDYTYPPALLYFGNSPIRVSENNSVRNSDFLDGAYEWETGTWSASIWKDNGKVVAGTRAVAMMNNVQYGVAQLKTVVKYSSAAIQNGLQDNNAQNHPGSTEDNNVFHPGTGTGQDGEIYLTGILIGGQPMKVGWDYLPYTDINDNTYNPFAEPKMVYDKRINSATGGISSVDGTSTYQLVVPNDGTASEPNYTLLFDNYRKPSGSATEPTQETSVYVALEFVNGLNKDFWGNANIVRQGGTFYLLGELKLTDNEIKAFKDVANNGLNNRWNKASKIMPPYDANGDTQKGDAYIRIFMQDFVTSANFSIGETSLQKAYVTVPDLRSSKLSFGLSVDLDWNPGLVFDVDL